MLSNAKNTFLILGAAVIALFLISSATAVTTVQSTPVMTKVKKAEQLDSILTKQNCNHLAFPDTTTTFSSFSEKLSKLKLSLKQAFGENYVAIITEKLTQIIAQKKFDVMLEKAESYLSSNYGKTIDFKEVKKTLQELFSIDDPEPQLIDLILIGLLLIIIVSAPVVYIIGYPFGIVFLWWLIETWPILVPGDLTFIYALILSPLWLYIFALWLLTLR